MKTQLIKYAIAGAGIIGLTGAPAFAQFYSLEQAKSECDKPVKSKTAQDLIVACMQGYKFATDRMESPWTSPNITSLTEGEIRLHTAMDAAWLVWKAAMLQAKSDGKYSAGFCEKAKLSRAAYATISNPTMIKYYKLNERMAQQATVIKAQCPN